MQGQVTHQQAINIAHDERRPFCFRAEWFVIPYYMERLECGSQDL
jgi:hypothetical protein